MNFVVKKMTGKPGRRWEDNNKTDHKAIGYAGMDWI